MILPYKHVALLIVIATVTPPIHAQIPGSLSKPNVVFILTDDMSYETLSYNKARNYHTPHVDALAREGLVFTNCDAQPLCVPSRTKLVTGQYNYRNYTGWNSFELNIPALGTIMREAGYATGVYGKWHLSKTPGELGFDDYSLFNGSPGNLPYHEFFDRYFYNCPLTESDGDYVAGYSPDRFNELALRFIEKNREHPFFLFYSMSLAHNPFSPTPDSEDPHSTAWQKNFEDMVGYCDKMIGKLVRKLKETGLYENTVIIYTSDNSSKTLSHHMEDGTVVYGQKGTHTNDGCHVPLIIKYDGTHKTLDDLVDFADFYPTLADLAGYDASKIRQQMDGVSLAPLLHNQKRQPKPYIFSTYYHPLSVYIRDKRYKLFYDGRLYDLAGDPRELNPFYELNDSPQTRQAREKLKKQLIHILDKSDLAKYPTRKRLEETFGNLQTISRDEFMLGAVIFDGLRFYPRQEKIRFDLTPFLKDKKAAYRLRLAREHRSTNSGLSYADASVGQIRIIKNGATQSVITPENVSLTTRVDNKRLRETANPIISFLKEGDGSHVELGELLRNTKDRIELEVLADVSDPGNQWGDRIMLYFYLDR